MARTAHMSMKIVAPLQKVADLMEIETKSNCGPQEADVVTSVVAKLDFFSFLKSKFNQERRP